MQLPTYLTELTKDALLFVVDQQGRAINETTCSIRLYAARLVHQSLHGLRDTLSTCRGGCGEMEIMAVLRHMIISNLPKYTAGSRKQTSRDQREH